MTEFGLVKNHDKKVITNTKSWCVIIVNNGKNHDDFSLKKAMNVIYVQVGINYLDSTCN